MGGPIVFGPFAFDPEARELRRNGNTVRLQDQPAQVLGALLERHGHVVTREELQHLLWPDGTFVDFDQSLNKAVTKLRDALHDDADRPRYVETIPRRGYRFIAPITTPEPAPVPVSVATPPRRFALVGVALSLAAVAAVSLWLFLANRPAPIASIAVLPFENLTGDPQHEPEADALTEALISRLSQVSSFQRVISRTSVVQYKGTKKPLPEIAKALRVDAIVEGALLQSGDRVKATVRLIHAPRERPIWSQSYDHPANKIYSFQTALAIDVSTQARRLLPPDQRDLLPPHRSVDPEAYRAFARAAPLCTHWGDGDWSAAIRELNRALRIQPEFPDALASLSLCHWQELNKGNASPGANCTKSRELAQRALQLEPGHPLGQAVLSLVSLTCDWDWTRARESAQVAMERAPLDTTVAYINEIVLAASGRLREAIQVARRMESLSPNSPQEAQLVGIFLLLSGDYQEAELQLSMAIRLDRGNPWFRFQQASALSRLGRLEEARRHWTVGRNLLPPGQNSGADVWASYYQVEAGEVAAARKVLDLWLERANSEYVDPFDIAGLSAILGDEEASFRYLDIAFEQRSPSLFWLAVEPCFVSVRSYPRFQALLRKINFPG
jgi:TolB-like protein/DNA-binding winged helix-turn-helix (wHTH) protein